MKTELFDDWNEFQMGDIFNIYQSKTISKNNFDLDGKYPVFGANGIIGKYNKYNHEKSEVLVTCRGATCGTINLSEPFSWITGNSMVVTPKKEYDSKIEKLYLYYFLRSINFDKIISGTAQPQITREPLKKVKFFFPTLSTQKKIISILEKAEKVKEVRKEADELTDNFLNSVFIEMFGDPIRNEKKWNTKKMVDSCDLITDGVHKTPNYVQTGIPFVTATNLIGNKIDLINTKKITKEEHLLFIKKTKPKKNDLLMSKDGTIGVTRVIETDEEFSIFVSVILIKPKKELLDSQYLKYLFSSEAMQMRIKDKIKGIAIRHLHLTDLREMTIPIPPLSTQKKFTKITYDVDKMKGFQKQSRENINNIFNNFMQKAFKGELVC